MTRTRCQGRPVTTAASTSATHCQRFQSFQRKRWENSEENRGNFSKTSELLQVYSDADIVLSSEWVPPLTIAPAAITTDTRSQTSSLSQDTVSTASGDGRKKTSSVSFSVDDNENQSAGAEKAAGEVKKSKVSFWPFLRFVSDDSTFADAETLIISTVMGRGPHRRAGQARDRIRTDHQRLQSKCIFKSIFKVTITAR